MASSPPVAPPSIANANSSIGDASEMTEFPAVNEPEQLSLDKPLDVGLKSRLVIHKMVLVNFKSYAGRQEIGPFHKSFSAIVGPNGSGKSNTIDALLFVFGYRASKMRQGKLSELIHNSARYPDLPDCRVEVHFREIIDQPGPDAYAVVAGSDLIVARTAYRNNSSKYTINENPSTFTEVTTLLKHRGIDLDHKRFLILQGEVESIAQMKPKAPNEHEDGLLEYLEDIIGTSRYKDPIEETLVEVDKYNEDRAQKLNRLRIVEKEKNSLEDAKRETEDYLRLQNDLSRAQSRMYQWYVWQGSRTVQAVTEDITRFHSLLAAEVENNKDDIKHADQLQQHYDERVATYEEIKHQSDQVLKTLASHEKQEVALSEKRKHLNAKAKKLKKSSQEDGHARTEALRLFQDHTRAIEEQRTHIAKLELSLEEGERVLEGIRDGLKDKTYVFHNQIEAKQKELEPWTAKINSCRATLDIANGERNMLSNRMEEVKQLAAASKERCKALRDEQDSKQSELTALQQDKSKLSREISDYASKIKNHQTSLELLKARAIASRLKAEEAKASDAASHSQNAVLDSLTRLKNSGRIVGFHGRLGSLGTIPDKYDIAVSTACGALNHLVVDTVDQGQGCIEYLRRQNVGRASFLVLEKLQPPGPSGIATPENAPRLFDLIQPKEPRFSAAFFKAVGNTLVADDLDQANRIAFGGAKRWRVVTLAGQVIDTSGTMSGGGSKVMKGAMSSRLVADALDPSTLRRYEKESEELQGKLENALEEQQHFEKALEELTCKGPILDLQLEKVELDLATLEKRALEAERGAKEFKPQNEPDASDTSRIKELNKDIVSFETELKVLQTQSGTIENDIALLEKKILEIGGSTMLAQKSKVDGIKLHINLANDEITRAEVGKAKAEKDANKLVTLIDSNEAAFEEVQNALNLLDEELQECVDTVTRIRSKVEEAQQAVEYAKDDLDDIKRELDDQLKLIQKFKAKEMDIQQNLAEKKKELAESDRIVSHYRGLQESLMLEDIDDDEAETMKQDAVSQLKVYSEEELSTYDKKTLVADIGFLEERLQNAKVDLNVLKEYRKREEEFLARAQDLEQVTNLRDSAKRKYDDLRKARLDEFMSGFNTISSKLKEMYQMITLGGNAELELVDSMDPFSEGIIFSVMPPKKSWKNISNLSGGEKTLSSLALVFALHVFKPTPLYFMDEIDAALDFRNVSIVANYIKDRTKNAQFIIISLRNDMFELSHRLIGIYKTANATQSIAIDNRPLTTAVECN